MREQEGEVSCSHHRFPFILTYLQPCSICYIFFFLPIQHVLPCTLAEIYCIMFFLTSFHIPIPRLCHIPLSMSEIVYFCAWMNDDFISERLQKHCRLWNNVRCSQTRTALGENIRQSACINNKSRGKLSAYLSRKLVRTHKICCA